MTRSIRSIRSNSKSPIPFRFPGSAVRVDEISLLTAIYTPLIKQAVGFANQIER